MICDDLFKQLESGIVPDVVVLKKGHADACRTSNGDCLLHRCRTLEQLRQVASAVSDIDQAGAGGLTALMVYANEKRPEFCRFLLEQGANPSFVRTYLSDTPLHWADHGEIVDMLVASGAELEARDSFHRTPFLCAMFYKRPEAMAALVRHGADISVKDKDGSGAIHLAARAGFVDGIEFCLENGFDINERTQNQQTPIHFAVAFNELEAARFLVDRGADLNVRDSFNSLPLDYVNDQTTPDFIHYLRTQGAVATPKKVFAGGSKAFSRDLSKRLAKSKAGDGLLGASESEIADLEKAMNVRLPVLYREFLLVCGHGAGGMFKGLDWTIDQLASIRTNARKFCEEERIAFPADAFTFLAYLGENFWLMNPQEGDNPTVYLMDVAGIRSTDCSFADFVLQWQ